MQVWPVAAKMPAIAPTRALSRSASAKMMFGDLPPDGGTAGEADSIDPLGSRERLADARIAAHDVDHPRWKSGLLYQTAELKRRGRGVLRGLDDHAVARSQRRRELVRKQMHGRIPGRDQHGDAERLPRRVIEYGALI